MRPYALAFFLSSAAAVAATLAAAAPASANVTNIVLTANQTQNLDCPASIQLTVNVTGAPNQPFTAELLGTFNGSVKTLIGPVTGTIPASGTATGMPSVSVPLLSGTGNKLDFVAYQSGQFPVVQTLAISCKQPPSILKVEPEFRNGSQWRPNDNIMYTGEQLDLSITGSEDNSATSAPNRCMYQVTIKDLDNPSRGLVYTNTLAHFAPLNVGQIAPAGLYQVNVDPPSVNNGFYLPECGGHASTNVRVLNPVGWITGMDLVGFGFHFNAGDDMAMPQFCDNCTSIFSPAHNRSFLGVHPHTEGTTSTPNSQGTCAYQITAKRGGDVRGGEAEYINGQPGTPKQFIAFTGPIGNPENPYWYMYNDDSDTVTVTISTAHDLIFPSCYIVGGSISKTITFTQNLSLPPVHVQ